MKNPGTRIRGPLTPWVVDVRDCLLDRGYVPETTKQLLTVMAHLSRWMEDAGMGLSDLVPRRLEAFAVARRAAGYTTRRTVHGVSPIISALESLGVQFPPSPPQELSGQQKICAEYADYLAVERGLTGATTARRAGTAARFLRARFDKATPEPAKLIAVDVTRFVTDVARGGVAISTAKLIASDLRSFLRWLYLVGAVPQDLVGAVPRIAGWRRTSIPTGLSAADLRRVLDGCDRTRDIGLRDYAVLTLLSRLGLRRSEVAGVTLEDLDWKRGELLVRGKGGKQDRLPLPSDVGEGIVAYLRVRPRRSSRALFLGARAPYRALTPGAVTAMVGQALDRAGVEAPHRGAHLFRHTAATRLLDTGSSLSEIGQVLRHSNVDTTAIYAKVDMASLAWLVRPWPGGAA